MSVDERFEAFKAAHAAGAEPDPGAAVADLASPERAQLLALIDAFLARAPARAYDAEALAAFRAQPLARRVREAVGAEPVERLGHLRTAARIDREELMTALAEELGAPKRRAKVADYYHRLEWGTLDPARVSARVFEALGRLLGVSAERVRAAASQPFPPPAAPLHTRKAAPDPVLWEEAVAAAPSAAPAEPVEHDEIDDLFLRGDEPPRP